MDSSIPKVSWCHQIPRLDGRPFLHRQFRWSVPDEVMSQTWFFGGVLIHRARYHANAEQRQGYFCSGSLLEVPLCIECFNLIKKMVFPLPNSTANQYCDYPGDDTFFFLNKSLDMYQPELIHFSFLFLGSRSTHVF